MLQKMKDTNNQEVGNFQKPILTDEYDNWYPDSNE